MNAYGLARDHTSATERGQQNWKRLLIVDDDPDVTVTFKVGIEDTNNVDNGKKKNCGVYI